MTSPGGVPWKAQLHEFLTKYFPRAHELERLADLYFDDLKTEVAWDGSLDNQTFGLIDALDAHGRLAELWPALRAKREKLVPEIDGLERNYVVAVAAEAADEAIEQKAWGDAEKVRAAARATSNPARASAVGAMARGTGTAASDRNDAIDDEAPLRLERRGSRNPQRGRTAPVLLTAPDARNPARGAPQGSPAGLRAKQAGPRTPTAEDLAKVKARQRRLKAAADAFASVTKELDEALKRLPEDTDGSASVLEMWEDDPAIAVERVEDLLRLIQEAETGEERYVLLNQVIATALDGIDRAEDQNDYAAMSKLASLAEGAYEPAVEDMENPRVASLLIRATSYWRMKQTYASYEARRHES